MDRAEFLDLCGKVAVLPNGAGGMKDTPPEYRVNFKGMPFYPIGYKLTYTNKGKLIHTAILHDLKANSIMECELSKVEKGCE